MPAVANHSEAIKAFEFIVSSYQERVMNSGTIGAMAYDSGAEQGKATNTGSSQTVQPSNSDMICDVELAAKRSLKPSDWAYWKLFYKSCDVVVEPGDKELLAAHINSFSEMYREAVASIDRRVRVTLGAELKRCAIYPLNVYMSSVDVRNPRKAKGRWSHLYGN